MARKKGKTRKEVDSGFGAEYVRRAIEAIGRDELVRYYHAIKAGKVLVRPHNYLAVVIANHSSTSEEWLEKLVDALSPIVITKWGNPLKKKITFTEGECSCGYDRVTHPANIVSAKGTPPPNHLCPAATLTAMTLAKANIYVIVTDEPPEDAPKAKIADNLYVTYTANPRKAKGTVIYRPAPASQRYTPIERATQ